jgi:predicted amidohydrolase
MSQNLKICLIQFQSSADKLSNLEATSSWIEKACVKFKPHLIALPEVFNFRGKITEEAAQAEEFPELGSDCSIIDKSPSIQLIAKLAKKFAVSIMGGSIFEKSASGKHFNTAFYINTQGLLRAKYSKIHLFDVNITNYHQESDSRQAGNLDDTNLEVFSDEFELGGGSKVKINMAMVICYDLRFPELFRHLMFAQAKIPDLIFVPSAFSVATGPYHWEVLLRARAIENSVFIAAPNQVGKSDSGFACHGESMVIDPWGTVLAKAGTREAEIVYAELKLERVAELRHQLPLTNARLNLRY